MTIDEGHLGFGYEEPSLVVLTGLGSIIDGEHEHMLGARYFVSVEGNIATVKRRPLPH